jgi:hypothetical protein
MKLISVQLARSTWLADVNEFNPRGLNLFAALVPALIENYKFKVYPKETDDFQNGMRFSKGEYVNKSGEPLMVELTIFNDGVVADTNASTQDCDEFLVDITESLPGLGLSFDPDMIRRRIYLSQLLVKGSPQLNAISQKLNAFGKQLSEAVGHNSHFEFSAFEFWPDQTQVLRPANFSFQRKAGGPFSSDRYWSQAPLPTDKHLELLNELETLLS